MIYDVSYKTPHGTESLCIIFDKVDGYIRPKYGPTYLALLHSDEKYENFDKIRHLIMS